jgi:hypothetical protein
MFCLHQNLGSVSLHICRVVLLQLKQRRAAAANGLGNTIKYLRRTTSGAAGSDLGITINFLRQTPSGAAGNGLGATIKYMRRTTSAAAGRGRAPRSSTSRVAPRASD